MSSKNDYTPLDEDSKKIAELVKKQRFRNQDVFIDRAIQVLLAWELDPETSLDIMKGYPQTEKQKQVLQAFLDKQVYQENFPNEKNHSVNETQRMIDKNKSKNDHLELLGNLDETKEYIKKFKIPKFNDSEIPYDQYPILFRFYSRFAPAKIVLCVLADLLRQNPNSDKINLKILRADALDIAAEFNDKILQYEKINNLKRTQKISTGFPKLGDNIEENVAVHKRFRDQYIGKVRVDRDTKKKYFEGVLAALGFVKLINEGSEEYVTLTEIGREFYLLDNPILKGDYTRGLYEEEAELILSKIIPKFKLEQQFYEVALDTIQKYQYDPVLQQEPITKILDQEIIRATNEFVNTYPEEAKRFDFSEIKYETDERTGEKIIDKTNEKYVEGWRVASMGRLMELKQIEWLLEKGKSVFTIRDNKQIIAI